MTRRTRDIADPREIGTRYLTVREAGQIKGHLGKDGIDQALQRGRYTAWRFSGRTYIDRQELED